MKIAVKNKIMCVLVSFAIVTVTPLMSQNKFHEYSTTCYCKTLFNSPASVLALDNNWEVFKAIPPDGIEKSELLTKIKVNDSQLELLLDWRILKKMKDKYFRNIPLIDSANSSRLSQQALQVANTVAKFTRTDIEGYVRTVEKQYPNHVFALLSSYVVDGIIWDELESRKVIASRNLSDSVSLWNGEFWFDKTIRQLDFGTNTHANNGNELAVLWNEISWKHLQTLYDKRILTSVFAFLHPSERYKRDSIVAVLKSYGIIGNTGGMNIPVIAKNDHDPLFVGSKSLAKKIADAFLKTVSAPQLMRQFGFANDSQAIIIFYHVFMWNYLKVLAEDKIVKIPELLTTGILKDKSQLAEHLFVIKEDQ